MRHPYGTGVSGVAIAAAAYTLAIRPWQLGWGATEEESTRLLPGDDLIAQARYHRDARDHDSCPCCERVAMDRATRPGTRRLV
jgi:hypothetical protein